MSKNIVLEGWLYKSPPINGIWRSKWRRRWFALRHSGELPGQYFLDYYANRNCRRRKGTINLDLCEQVEAGLRTERSPNGNLDSKLRGSVFTIQTQSRIYHLEADCEADMAKWVDAICRVCGLQSEENNYELNHQETIELPTISRIYQSTVDPYIPISECITGVRTQQPQRAYKSDPRNVIVGTHKPVKKFSNQKHQTYMTQPYLKPKLVVSDAESNTTEEEKLSLDTWASAKSYTKPKTCDCNAEPSEPGPPVPPRPPKTFAMSKQAGFKNAKIVEMPDPVDPAYVTITYQQPTGVICQQPRRRLKEPIPDRGVPARISTLGVWAPVADDDDELAGPSTVHYVNIGPRPPAVDRNLKPRYFVQSSSSAGKFDEESYPEMSEDTVKMSSLPPLQPEEPIKKKWKKATKESDIKKSKKTDEQIERGESGGRRSDVLQYLDLDFGPPSVSSEKDENGKPIEVVHRKTASALEDRAVYKTVDFLKTEAFNMIRRDAEAKRAIQQY